MSDRAHTSDLREGLGLYRWGDDRPAVQDLFPEASYGIYDNIYAFQRTFGVEGLFGAGADVPEGLRELFAYVDPLAPEIVFDGISSIEARALLDAVGCHLPLASDEVEWEIGEAKVVFYRRSSGDVWLKIAGPASKAAELDDQFGPANEMDDEYDE